MSTAWVLMTAMPPTLGHRHLMQFAGRVADRAHVLICTQPGEPYALERADAVRDAASTLPNVTVSHFHQTIPQTPAGHPRFWQLWVDILGGYGLVAGDDVIVASEAYGLTLAQHTGTQFVPYDLDRSIHPIRATEVRADPLANFGHIMPEFQSALMQRITIIGAESTGKTTLAHALASQVDGHFLPEWARPYLEALDTPAVDVPRMNTIWRGQKALQAHAGDLVDRPFVIQDTDLFATVGFWQNWSPDTVPAGLVADARDAASGLYLVTRSNIPFEPDPLRYGGDRRETPDAYWLDLLDRFGLNYRVIDAVTPEERLAEASAHVLHHFASEVRLAYDRTLQP